MQFVPNKKFFQTISFRIAFLFSLTFCLGIAGAFLIAYFEISYSLEKSSREVISSKLHEASVILADQNVKGFKDFFSNDANRQSNASFMFRILSKSGESIYIKDSRQEQRFDFKKDLAQNLAPDKLKQWHSLDAINDEDKFDILTEQVGADFYLQVGKSSEDREAILTNILNIFVGTGVLLVFFGGGLGLWYARSTLQPIRHLLTTIKEIEKGHLGNRVPLGPAQDELYDLGSTFNRMISRVDSLVRLMRDSLDHVAHDIRTPLTRIRAVAEDAIISSQPTSLREALEECAASATDISEIVDQLMNISEAESGTLTLKREFCLLQTLFNDVIDVYEFVALEKSIDIELEVQPLDLEWFIGRKRIKQVFANLLDNAIKFSDPHSKILVRAAVDRGCLEISVIDEGYGISAQDLPQIWDRLFRGDRSRSSPGAGLGLSIVRAIVSAHGGNVRTQTNRERGTTFSITMPVPEKA